MNIKKPIYIGIDFENDFSQVSFYDFTAGEPVSASFSGENKKFDIPSVLSKSKGKDQWFAGEEAENSATLGEAVLVNNLIGKAIDRNPVMVDDVSVMPVELISIFLNEIIQTVKVFASVNEIAGLSITVEQFNISLLNVISEACIKLGIPKDKLFLSSHTESFVYYALCQKAELFKNDVALFDYSKDGLKFTLLRILNYRGQRIVVTGTEDYSERIAEATEDTLDKTLAEIAREAFDKKNISTVYLTGKGFPDNLNLPEFVRIICDRKKAFGGQNLYVKGACFQAYDTLCGDRMKQFLLGCAERITTGIELKVSSRGKDKILRIVKPGVNWFGVDYSVNLIVDDAKELEIFLSPIDSMEKKIIKIPLTDFPERPRKATLITLKLSFTSDKRCHLMIIDRGFGEFFASSGIVINKEILL